MDSIKFMAFVINRPRLDGDNPLKSSIFIHSRLHSNRLYSNRGNRDNRDPNRDPNRAQS